LKTIKKNEDIQGKFTRNLQISLRIEVSLSKNPLDRILYNIDLNPSKWAYKCDIHNVCDWQRPVKKPYFQKLGSLIILINTIHQRSKKKNYKKE
jgi:hypothetical protein